MTELLRRRLDVAAHRIPADLVLKNGNIINVFSEEIITGDVAIVDGYIAAVGQDYEGLCTCDCTGQFICPGFIDAHMHLESTMVTPAQLAHAILPSGTTTIIADPHELVNVCGSEAMQYLLDTTENIPLTIYWMLPSSVPATPFETNGAPFTAQDMEPFFAHPRVLGLGEVMCYPDVLRADGDILEKLVLADDTMKDGHAPRISGAQLQTYAAAGIRTDHECTTFAEAAEKLRAGLAILVREGSAAHNLNTLITGWLESGLPSDRFLLCTDDKHLDDIEREGHIRWNIHQAITLGVPPIKAIKMGTYNTAVVYGLSKLGAVAPGYLADVVVLDNLLEVTVHSVYKKGKLIKSLLDGVQEIPVPEVLLHSMHGNPVTKEEIALAVTEKTHCIGMIPDQITTKHVIEAIPQRNGYFQPDSFYTKLCVAERHGKNGDVRVCPIKGYGIQGGAIATSVAHDSHNIIAAGDNDEDLISAINRLKIIGGGYVLVSKGHVLGELPLPVGGLMSMENCKSVQQITEKLLQIAKDMGIPHYVDPFISLSFMALPVIPEIRLTDKGLFDVTTFSIID